SVWIAIDAIGALVSPHPIAYAQAMVVAVSGLLVNAASAWLLARGGQGHGHGHPSAHDHAHPHAHAHGHEAAHVHRPTHRHHDHNYRVAFVHVLADALTSVLAIVALAAGLGMGWRWLDPVVALLGGGLIAHWALTVLRDAARTLVDASPDLQLRDAVRRAIQIDGDAHVADLHVWQVGPAAWSAVLSVVADRPLSPETYRDRLHDLSGLQHVTIEVHQCRGEAAASHR
ncbi:MAG TPA: cation diffusion facilitator family transporter, partial [Burkholderiaceae bacterium]|nr:cation diffusion facilitator family transporter [Burkholderiaceae bacterium]